MKRLPVQVAADDLDRSTAFYSTLFAARPVVAKRGRNAGVGHLGLRTTDAEEPTDAAARGSKAA
jgi:catechol 2,3-dioxygenase-like lactoylglutathione lyase family enzyme